MSRVILVIFVVALLPTFGDHQLFAADSPVVESMQDIGKTPWYDPEKESIVPVPLSTRKDDTANRESRWLPGAKKISPSSSASSGATGTGMSWGSAIGWFILTLFFVGITGLILYAFSQISPDTVIRSNRRDDDLTGAPDAETQKRVEHLPAELRGSGINLRAEAERLMQQGDYDEAIKCLFGHQLLLLDRVGKLRLSRGKTNNRYVNETRRQSADAASLLRSTVSAFEASYFGRHTPSTETFAILWADNLRLESLASRTTEAAA